MGMRGRLTKRADADKGSRSATFPRVRYLHMAPRSRGRGQDGGATAVDVVEGVVVGRDRRGGIDVGARRGGVGEA